MTRPPFEEQRRDVEAVLQRFAKPSKWLSSEWLSYLLPDLARLIVAAGRDPPYTVSHKAARTKLAKAKESAKSLLDYLRPDASLTVQLPWELRRALVLVAQAEVDLRAQRGSPSKDAATRVAHLAAEHFERLTGSPPTRNTRLLDGIAQRSNSRFTEFLVEIYGALRLEASAESQARSAIAERRRRAEPVYKTQTQMLQWLRRRGHAVSFANEGSPDERHSLPPLT